MNWQDLLALTAVAVAMIYLWRHLRQTGSRKKSAGCSSCLNCPMQSLAEPLVTIDLEERGERAEDRG